MPIISRKKTVSKSPQSPEAIAMRRIMREADPQQLGAALNLPEEDTGERQHFLFYQDEGGLRATDEANENMDVIYYLGVIDILTPYNTTKKLEHLWKGLQSDRVSLPGCRTHVALTSSGSASRSERQAGMSSAQMASTRAALAVPRSAGTLTRGS